MLVIFDVEVIFGIGINIPVFLVRIPLVSRTCSLKMLVNNFVGSSYTAVVVGLKALAILAVIIVFVMVDNLADACHCMFPLGVSYDPLVSLYGEVIEIYCDVVVVTYVVIFLIIMRPASELIFEVP